MPEMSRALLRNLLVVKERERMQFRSRCSRVPRLACDRSCGGVRSPVPCFLFQKGSKRECFRKYMFLFLFFSFIFSSFLLLFPSTYRPPIFRLSSALGAVQFRSTVFFNVKNIRWPFSFFSNFLSLSACGISFHFKVCESSHSCVFRSSPLSSASKLVR